MAPAEQVGAARDSARSALQLFEYVGEWVVEVFAFDVFLTDGRDDADPAVMVWPVASMSWNVPMCRPT